MTSEKNDFTKGSILKKLALFMLPILGALVLQAAYGAVDLLVVGRSFHGKSHASGFSRKPVLHNAHATFFMLGQNVQNYQDDVKRMLELGCEIGNHSWDHANMYE